MKKISNRLIIYLPMVVCLGYGSTGLAMEFKAEANPPACEDHNYKVKTCANWSSLTELQHPDAWEFSRRNREDRGRWYGETVAQAAAPQETPRVIVLEGVNFDFDQSTIRPDAFPILNSNARDLKSSEYMKIKVVGHTDSIGSEDYNQALSERRANAVRDYLISQGIDADRITAEGRGESEAIAPNVLSNGQDNPSGRAKNRRAAELQVWDRH